MKMNIPKSGWHVGTCGWLTPEQAIENLPDLLKGLHKMRCDLQAECDDLGELWAGMGKVSGQRADHAATLLTRLQPHLVFIEAWAHTCNAQIDAYKADPFGKETPNANRKPLR